MFTVMGTSPFTFLFEKVFTIAEAADRLGISPSEAYGHVQDGSLSAFRVGRGSIRRHLRVTDDDLERFVQARRVAPALPQAGPRRGGSCAQETRARGSGSFASEYLARPATGRR